MGQDQQIVAQDGSRFAAYVALPAVPRAPGLVLIQYICGVNRVMREIADDFAAKGFIVAVPDLFWRQEPGVQLINDPTRPSPRSRGGRSHSMPGSMMRPVWPISLPPCSGFVLRRDAPGRSASWDIAWAGGLLI